MRADAGRFFVFPTLPFPVSGATSRGNWARRLTRCLGHVGEKVPSLLHEHLFFIIAQRRQERGRVDGLNDIEHFYVLKFRG